MSHNTIHFGPFRLETEPDRLQRGSAEIPLRPKSLSVLAYLTRRPGRLVTKDELREQVWGTVHVSDTTLRVTVREIRAALGEDQSSPQHVETVPGRGYRFVPNPDANLGFQSAEDQGAEPPEDQARPIVGRRQEIEYLLNRFLEADKGRRQLVFVAGEPGAGKTTLVELFTKRLAERPQTALVSGQCVMSFGAGEAYGPVLDALGKLAARPGGEALVSLLDRYAPMWLAQLPALVESEELEGLQHRIEGATRERMVRELNDVFERLTREATLVLVLEDLHWSDVSTLELLTSIAQHHEPARLLILATYRPADAEASSPALREAIGELRGRGLAEHLDLELLTRRNVRSYVAARLGDADSEDVADRVFERTRGNPLFMVNVFDHLVQAQAIRKVDRWLVDGAAGPLSQVPVGLRPFIQGRLDSLSPEEREILDIASVVGVDFAAAALLPGTSPVDLKQDLERIESRLEALAARAHLIEDRGVTEWPHGNLSARYRFHHALYREVLYQENSEAKRARLHLKIGEHLEAAFGTEGARLAATLADHFERGRDPEKGTRYQRMAGEQALGRHAYPEAAGHLQRALEAFDQAGSRPADGDPEDRVRWELEVCSTLAWTLSATRGYSDPEVVRINARARSLIELIDDPAIQFPALFNLWLVSQSLADPVESANLVSRMSELAAGTENDELAMMYSSAKARSQFYLGDLAGCAEHMRRVLTPYDQQRLVDVHGRYGVVEHAVACHGVNGWLLWLQGCPDQALAETRKALKLAERLGGPNGNAIAGYLALPTLQFRGDTAQLDRRVSDTKRLCAEQGYAVWLAWATCFEGWVAGARGNLDEGIALMEHGVDDFLGTDTRAHLTHLLALLAELCLRAGRIDAARERLAEARAQAESSGERYWEAEIHRLEGEILLAAADDGGREGDSSDGAEACFKSALEIARRQQARSLELRAALGLSRLWSRSRRDEAQRLLGGVLETFSEGHDTADLRAASEQMAQLANGVTPKAR